MSLPADPTPARRSWLPVVVGVALAAAFGAAIAFLSPPVGDVAQADPV